MFTVPKCNKYWSSNKKKTVSISKAHFKIFKLYNSAYWIVFVVHVNLIRASNYEYTYTERIIPKRASMQNQWAACTSPWDETIFAYRKLRSMLNASTPAPTLVRARNVYV